MLCIYRHLWRRRRPWPAGLRACGPAGPKQCQGSGSAGRGGRGGAAGADEPDVLGVCPRLHFRRLHEHLRARGRLPRHRRQRHVAPRRALAGARRPNPRRWAPTGGGARGMVRGQDAAYVGAAHSDVGGDTRLSIVSTCCGARTWRRWPGGGVGRGHALRRRRGLKELLGTGGPGRAAWAMKRGTSWPVTAERVRRCDTQVAHTRAVLFQGRSAGMRVRARGGGGGRGPAWCGGRVAWAEE